MLNRLTRAVKTAVRRRVHECGRTIKHMLRPVRTGAALVCAVSIDAVRPRSALVAENALLRQQILVLRRAAPSRPRLHAEDRLILVLLARLNTAWRDALHVVKPDTLLRWHRDLFTLLWHHKSRRRGARGRLRVERIDLIQAMATANGRWGAERIRGDLLKLGIRVSKRTVQQYMRSVRPRGQHGQTWGTFLRNHTHDIWAGDVLQLYDAWFRPIDAFFIVAHGTREVVHVNVTRSPTDAWVAQQLREATPYDSAPRFLIRDNDGKFGRDFAAAATSADIDVVPIPPRSPNLNAICERFLGGLRRECLDHVLLLGEDHLRRVLAEWVGHFNGGRPHQGIGQRIPNQRQRPGRVQPCRRIVAFPGVGRAPPRLPKGGVGRPHPSRMNEVARTGLDGEIRVAPLPTRPATPAGVQAAIASEDTHTVTSPRRTRA